MTRFLYIQNEYPASSQTFVTNEVRGLLGRGHDVAVVSSRRGSADADPAETIVILEEQPITRLVASHGRALLRSPLRYGRYLLMMLRLGFSAAPWSAYVPFIVQSIGQPAPSFVHTHFATRGAALASLVAAWYRVPRGVTTHAADIYVTNRSLAKQLRGARVATSTTRNVSILESLGFRAHTVIPNGVPIRPLQTERPRPDKAFSVVSVGRLVEKKGHADLLRAVATCRKRGTDVKCVIVGDGPERAALTRLAQELGIEDAVQFAGMLSHRETFELYTQADAFALCSRVATDGDVDGLPVAVLDAASTGLPVIAPTISGLAEFVSVEVGWPVVSADTLSIAHALEQAASDVDERHRRGRGAYEKVRTSFSIDTQLDGIERLAGER